VNATEPGRLARLEGILGGVEQSDRRDVYLTIAKEAVAKGRVEMARFAAAQAVHLAEDASAERQRAGLYEGAALIVTEDFDRGVEILGAIQRGKLAEPDAALLDSALAIAGQLRRMPDTPDGEPPKPPAGRTRLQTRCWCTRARRSCTWTRS
ncbi:MAG: hypothetical protein HC869_19040, partial [Rhodospirillales bacterium]|nr:hypothetical protein [Rhodospirillales bacterium]